MGLISVNEYQVSHTNTRTGDSLRTKQVPCKAFMLIKIMGYGEKEKTTGRVSILALPLENAQGRAFSLRVGKQDVYIPGWRAGPEEGQGLKRERLDV